MGSFGINKKQEADKLWTYNVAMRQVSGTIFPVKKEIRIKCSECVFVALGILHAMRVRHILICVLLGSTIFFHIISQKARIKNNVIAQNCVF